MRKILYGLLYAIALCHIPLIAVAHNGSEDIATTITQISRGGAFIATEPDSGALMGNPAALAFLERPELAFDARVWHSKFDFNGALGGQGQGEDYVVPNIGYAAPFSDRWAWGAGVYTVTNSATRVIDYDLSLTGAPPGTIDRTSTKVRFVLFSPGLAYRINERTAIGAVLHFTNGSADMQAYDMLGHTVGYRLGDLHGEGWALRTGIYHRASSDTTLGAYWRSRTHLEISDGLLEYGALSPGAGAAVPGVSVEGFQFPEQYGAGIAQRLNSEWTTFGEYRRIRWSKVAHTVSFVPPQGQPTALAMDWKDQDVYILGAEYRPDCLQTTTWRLGVNYAASPVPDHTVSPLYAAINEWHYTAGWERRLSDNLSLVSGAVYAPEVTRTSSADNYFNSILGLGQPFTMSKENWEFGLGLTWRFGKTPDSYQEALPAELKETAQGTDNQEIVVDDTPLQELIQ